MYGPGDTLKFTVLTTDADEQVVDPDDTPVVTLYNRMTGESEPADVAAGDGTGEWNVALVVPTTWTLGDSVQIGLYYEVAAEPFRSFGSVWRLDSLVSAGALDAQAVRDAVGLAEANLDSQINTLGGAIIDRTLPGDEYATAQGQADILNAVGQINPDPWVNPNLGDDQVYPEGTAGALLRTRSKQTDVETLLARLSEVRAAKLDEVSTLTQADVRSALLTMGVASVTAAISGNTIELYRGDSYTIPFQNLGDLTSRTNLWFTAKAKASDTDAAALVQIAETGDLLVLNGSATLPTGATASIVVDDEAAGTGRILVSAAAMAVLAPVSDGRWDLQWRAASGDVATPGRGTFKVLADITRRVA